MQFIFEGYESKSLNLLDDACALTAASHCGSTNSPMQYHLQWQVDHLLIVLTQCHYGSRKSGDLTEAGTDHVKKALRIVCMKPMASIGQYMHLQVAMTCR